MADDRNVAKDYRVWLDHSDDFWKGGSIAIGARDARLIDPAVVDAFVSAELALNAILVSAGEQPSFEERLVPAFCRCVQLNPELANIERDCVLLDSRFDDANEPTEHRINSDEAAVLLDCAERIRSAANATILGP